MKAIEVKKKYLKNKMLNDCSIIAIGKGFWFHVHDDEELPNANKFVIAICPLVLPYADGEYDKKPPRER